MKLVNGSNGKTFYLHSKELSIKEECERIIRDRSLEKIKDAQKIQELFHTICYLKTSGVSYDEIIPHEPGDFIIRRNGKNKLIEVTEVYSTKDEHKFIEGIIARMFNLKKKEEQYDSESSYDIKGMGDKLHRIIEKKKNKGYFDFPEFDETILLIVMSEQDQCAITGDTLTKEFRIEVQKRLANKSFDRLKILNYFSSGLDNGPTAYDFDENYQIWKNSGLF